MCNTRSLLKLVKNKFYFWISRMHGRKMLIPRHNIINQMFKIDLESNTSQDKFLLMWYFYVFFQIMKLLKNCPLLIKLYIYVGSTHWIWQRLSRRIIRRYVSHSWLFSYVMVGNINFENWIVICKIQIAQTFPKTCI